MSRPRRLPLFLAATFVVGASVAGTVALSVNAAVPTTCNGLTVNLSGTDGPDLIVGTTGSNVIATGEGDDVIISLDGNDTVCSGGGNDTVALGAGNDFLSGAEGSDRGYGEAGTDTCRDVETVISCTNTNTPPPTTTTTQGPTTTTTLPVTTTTQPVTTTTVPPTGHFNTLPVGAVLPTEAACAVSVRGMTENRPNNTPFNQRRGTAPNATYPRATGNFVGTTDEIIQWTACKWGIDEDWVRAQIVTESFWDQRTVGDTAAGDGCTSHGLGQVRRCYHDNAFENSVQSSAYNLDYTYAVWRSCFEGEMTWLNTVERGATYQAGDQLGCMGVWFSGRYRTPPAIQYMNVVQGHFNNEPWLDSGFPPAQPTGPPATTTTTQPATTTTQAPTTTTTQPATTTTTLPPVTTTTQAPPTGNRFVETFDGAPASPQRYWQDSSFAVVTHKKSKYFGSDAIDSMAAEHATSCDAPPATHGIDTLDETVFLCRDHVMTAINADDYGAIYLTPAALVDFSGGVATIDVDVSTLRRSGRDWWDIWITPPSAYLQLPLQDWLPDLHGPPRNAVHVYMDFDNNRFDATIFRNGVETEVSTVSDVGWQTVLTPSATTRSTFRLELSSTSLKFGLPNDGLTWINTTFPALPFNEALVQFGHHSYSPSKAMTTSKAPNTWHWDNVVIDPATPFAIAHTTEDWAWSTGANATMDFASPTPAGHLSFSAIGSNIRVRFNGGAFQNAQLNPQQSGRDENYRSYWHPIPAGTTRVEFSGSNWAGGQYLVSDVNALGV